MIEGEIYVVGGYDNLKTRYLRTVEKYSPTSDQWTRLPSMKLARQVSYHLQQIRYLYQSDQTYGLLCVHMRV